MKTRKILLPIIIVLAVVFALELYLAWENKTIVTTKIEVVSDKIPESFSGYRIVHVSDLHNAEFVKSVVNPKNFAYDGRPQIVFSGKSNVGKSSVINRLLNRIPGININDINPESTSNINKIPNFNKENAVRVFKAEIFGDINGSNYVKSFKWIKH